MSIGYNINTEFTLKYKTIILFVVIATKPVSQISIICVICTCTISVLTQQVHMTTYSWCLRYSIQTLIVQVHITHIIDICDTGFVAITTNNIIVLYFSVNSVFMLYPIDILLPCFLM
jgi:hypothetical protein